MSWPRNCSEMPRERRGARQAEVLAVGHVSLAVQDASKVVRGEHRPYHDRDSKAGTPTACRGTMRTATHAPPNRTSGKPFTLSPSQVGSREIRRRDESISRWKPACRTRQAWPGTRCTESRVPI